MSQTRIRVGQQFTQLFLDHFADDRLKFLDGEVLDLLLMMLLPLQYTP